MTKLEDLFERKIRQSSPEDAQAYLSCARELTQQMALFGLNRAGFNKLAAFHGGTALRILYDLDRYSEDLDFCLIQPNENFDLSLALEPMLLELRAWGLDLEVVDRSNLESNVKKVFLKETSLGAIIHVNFPTISPKQKIHIKVEVDANPPAGAGYQIRVVDFPTNFNVNCHDIETLFSGKMHALLKREFVKGRDWFDLDFYFRERTKINFNFLKNALIQSDQSYNKIEIDIQWIKTALTGVINTINFSKVKADVLPFVFNPKQIELWSKEYFLEKLDVYVRRYPK